MPKENLLFIEKYCQYNPAYVTQFLSSSNSWRTKLSCTTKYCGSPQANS